MTDEPSLFAGTEPRAEPRDAPSPAEASRPADAPLAARMRPRRLAEFVGQAEHKRPESRQ